MDGQLFLNQGGVLEEEGPDGLYSNGRGRRLFKDYKGRG